MLNKPDAGETKKVPIELQPNALLVFGPQPVGVAGFTANVDAPASGVHVTLACADQGEALAAAYVAGEPLPAIKTLAVKDVRGKGTLRIGPASCPVVLVAQELGSGARGAAFDWQRPLTETARSTGGPIIECPEPAQRVHTSNDCAIAIRSGAC